MILEQKPGKPPLHTARRNESTTSKALAGVKWGQNEACLMAPKRLRLARRTESAKVAMMQAVDRFFVGGNATTTEGGK